MNKTTTQALNYGLSFHINNQLDPLDIGKAFINLEKNSRIDSNNINICKGLVYSCLANNNENNIPQRFISTIKSIKNDKNIHITKADKANSIVLINKNQYLEKMNLLLSDLETYIPLNKNPVEKLNNDFNSNLRKILNTEKSEYIDKFKSRMSTLPYMYGLIKTHKQGFPIRPIISTVGSASYKLSKYLVSILTPLVGTISNSNIKNNSDLIMKLNNCKPNYKFKLVSFDVTSLFTKVPIDDLLIYLKPELEKYKETLELSPDIIIDLIKLCVLDLKFVFNEKFYKQKFGLSMGNPLSPVLSNIYMEFFEKNLLTKIKYNSIVWYRYIDDILCLWPENENLNEFLDKLNNLANTIKFTVEIEKQKSLSFLDVLIYRETNNIFKFDVYRKPTSNNSFIHFYSGHSDNIKYSVFISMFLRALRVCSQEYYMNEIKYIFKIGKDLKYPTTFLERSLSKAKSIFYKTDNQKPEINKNALILPFNENLLNIKAILKKLNINLIFTFNNTIKNILIKNSPKTSTSCIYKIPCNHCEKYYVGQTSKSLQTRIKQHQYNIRTANESSAIFLHYQQFDHPVSWKDSSVIMSVPEFYKRNLLESIIIKTTDNNNINIHPGLYISDGILEFYVKKYYDFMKHFK